jgi:hypothetical protein
VGREDSRAGGLSEIFSSKSEGPVTDTRLGRLQAGVWAAGWLRHGPVTLLGGLYLYAIGLKAARTPLWYDEIVTYHVSALGGPFAIVEALLAKADNHPPLDYILRHFSMSLFGGSELAFRLPTVVAMLAGALCLYGFVLRRTSVLPALIAFSFPFATLALRYSYEGRAYAFLMASMCAALLAWQLATERQSIARLALLTLCLSLGPYAHYYGVLNYAPIAVGEALRCWERRKISWPIVACFAVSLVSLAPLVPLALNATEFSEDFWTRLGPSLPLLAYSKVLDHIAPALAAALIGCATAVFLPQRTAEARPGAPVAIPFHEVGAAITLCLLPFFTYLLAELVTRAFTFKYVINTALGVGLLIAYLTAHVESRQRLASAFVAGSVALWMAIWLGYIAIKAPDRMHAIDEADLRLVETATQPVVVFGAHRFLEMHFYLPASLREKIYHVMNPTLAAALTGKNSNEKALHNLRPFVPMNVVDLCAFTQRHQRFLVKIAASSWVVERLVAEGAEVRVLAGQLPAEATLAVSLKGPSGC